MSNYSTAVKIWNSLQNLDLSYKDSLNIKGHYAMSNTKHSLITLRLNNAFHCGLNLSTLAHKVLLLMLLFLLASVAQAQNTLRDIKFAGLPNNQVQLSFQFANTPVEPLAFAVDNPARIALDFLGTNNGLSDRFQRWTHHR